MNKKTIGVCPLLGSILCVDPTKKKVIERVDNIPAVNVAMYAGARLPKGRIVVGMVHLQDDSGEPKGDIAILMHTAKTITFVKRKVGWSIDLLNYDGTLSTMLPSKVREVAPNEQEVVDFICDLHKSMIGYRPRSEIYMDVKQ